jgi:hypothetical protein
MQTSVDIVLVMVTVQSTDSNGISIKVYFLMDGVVVQGGWGL